MLNSVKNPINNVIKIRNLKYKKIFSLMFLFLSVSSISWVGAIFNWNLLLVAISGGIIGFIAYCKIKKYDDLIDAIELTKYRYDKCDKEILQNAPSIDEKLSNDLKDNLEIKQKSASHNSGRDFFFNNFR